MRNRVHKCGCSEKRSGRGAVRTNLQPAFTMVEDFEEDVDELDVKYPNLRKFARTAHITRNIASILIA